MAKRKYLEIQREGNGGVIDDQSPAAVGIEWERRPGPRDLRNKKIEAHDQYAKELETLISTDMEGIYTIIKQLRDDVIRKRATPDRFLVAGRQIIPFIHLIRKHTFNLTKEYIKSQKLGSIPKGIKLMNFCYDQDETKLNGRIIDIFKKYSNQIRIESDPRAETMTYSLFGLMFRIANTESMYISNHLLALVDKSNAQFGEYVSGENCTSADDTGNCDNFCNGIHTLATLHQHIPPFHPNCNCFAVYYTIDELNDSNKEEQK